MLKQKISKIFEKTFLKEDGNLSSLTFTMPASRLERRKEMAKHIPKLEVLTIGKPKLTALTVGEQEMLQNTLLERILKLHSEYAKGGTNL